MTSPRHIDHIMGRLRDCAWNPFKLHEIVTLEGCLQECSTFDPKFNLLLRKLANESVFVEPARRLRHLARSKQDELDDAEYKRKSLELRDQVDKLNDELHFYGAFMDDLLKSADEMRAQIHQLERSFMSLDDTCKLLNDEFSLLLKRVYVFFDSSFHIINKLPAFVQATRQSKLVQQAEMLPTLYRKSLLKLIKQLKQQPQLDSATVKHEYKQLAIAHLNSYLTALISLYRDLALVERLYSTEIPDELEYVRAFEQHIRYLERPIAKPLRRLTIVACDDEFHAAPSNNNADKSGGASRAGAGADAAGPNVAQDCELPLALDFQPATGDDPELACMLSQIAKLCKRINGVGGG